MPADASCTRCTLSAAASHVCTWGRRRAALATTQADCMILGEANGSQEDAVGQVFIGPSGKLLDAALDEVGLADPYLTNTVKCQSYGKPKLLSIKACADYLDEEISQVQPQAILALGETAWHRMGGVGSITEAEGKEVWSTRYNCWVMPARHPAFILRAMGHRSSWVQVLHRFKLLLEGGLHKECPVDVRVVSNIEGLVDLWVDLQQAKSIVYDFETNRLPWWHRDFKALTVSFTFERGKAIVLPLEHPESPFRGFHWKGGGDTRAVMTSPAVKKTAHQGFFDDLVWYRTFGYLPYITCDTMALAHLLDENRPRGLKWLIRTMLGWPDYGIDTRDLSSTPLVDVAKYNGIDTAGTWEVRERLLHDLSQDGRLAQYFSRVLMPGIRMVERIMVNGIAVNFTTLQQSTAVQRKAMVDAAVHIPVENPASSQQIAKWLYDEQHLPVLKQTAGGAPCTDEETINQLAAQYPQAKQVLTFRKHAKNLSTYLDPTSTAEDTSIDHRIHPDYRIGPKTGRLASRFHTTPRDPSIRSIYDAPDDHVLISADYKQVEARLVAWAACGRPATWDDVTAFGGPFLKALADPQRDVYREMAAAVLNKNLDQVTPEDRQMMGKVPTLAMLYKMSAEGFRAYAWREYQLQLSVQQAKHVHRTFQQLWPEIPAWHEREAKVITARGWNQSVLGRKIRIPDAMQRGEAAHEAIGTGINMPIQSLASDITMTAGVLFQQRIDELSVMTEKKPKLVGFVHDNLLVETLRLYTAFSATTLEAAMLDAPQHLAPIGLHLPPGLLVVETFVGAWGSKISVQDWLTPSKS